MHFIQEHQKRGFCFDFSFWGIILLKIDHRHSLSEKKMCHLSASRKTTHYIFT